MYPHRGRGDEEVGWGVFPRASSLWAALGVIWEAMPGLQHSHYVRGELFVFK